MLSSFSKSVLLAGAVLALGAGARAAPTIDPAGDFLPTFVGPQGADLDALSVEVFKRDNSVFDFTATLAGEIGTTVGGFYVFGVDRGAGTARFVAGDPSVGAGVLFDSVVVVNGDGTGVSVDLISGIPTPLAAGAITFDGASLSALVDVSALPSQGFATGDYTVNLWPRSPGMGNTFIADFAPDASNFGVTSVPEPASWAMLITGFGLAGTALRRRTAALARA